MCWQGITAIFTGLTVLAVLAGGGVMLWLLLKPRVRIVSPLPQGIWYYDYEKGNKKAGARIVLSVGFRNDGSDATTIDIFFETTIKGEPVVFTTAKEIRVMGKGTKKRADIVLRAIEGRNLKEDEILRGVLRCKPWHNRRMRIGKEYIDINLAIPQGSGENYYQLGSE